MCGTWLLFFLVQQQSLCFSMCSYTKTICLMCNEYLWAGVTSYNHIHGTHSSAIRVSQFRPLSWLNVFLALLCCLPGLRMGPHWSLSSSLAMRVVVCHTISPVYSFLCQQISFQAMHVRVLQPACMWHLFQGGFCFRCCLPSYGNYSREAFNRGNMVLTVEVTAHTTMTTVQRVHVCTCMRNQQTQGYKLHVKLLTLRDTHVHGHRHPAACIHSHSQTHNDANHADNHADNIHTTCNMYMQRFAHHGLRQAYNLCLYICLTKPLMGVTLHWISSDLLVMLLKIQTDGPAEQLILILSLLYQI